ncbi:ATP-binding protein [Azorhizobium caulinodans]|uniref:ATP-binding protein n=1 Tax=Azorhizobium caulinodans TaxID=7 RepID=UPI002FBF052F
MEAYTCESSAEAEPVGDAPAAWSPEQEPRILAQSAAGEKLLLDARQMAGHHMLIQAMTGGGKSFAMRRVLELSLEAQVPVLVFDAEDEFRTLKELFPHIVLIGGENADAPLDVERCAVTALTLLETRTSAIVQFRELDLADQQRTIAGFVDALMKAPQSLWAPLLICLDEAQRFAPQLGSSICGEAIATLMRQGRKRHFSALLATQRFSSVSKACLTQVSNFLLGRVTNDVDIKRAETELGFGRRQASGLRNLNAGRFFVRGPALSPDPMLVQVVTPRTRHGHISAMEDRFEPVPFDEVVARLNKHSVVQSADDRSSPGDNAVSKGEKADVSLGEEAGLRSDLSEDARRMLLALAGSNRGISREALGVLVGLSARGARFTGALGELMTGRLVGPGGRRLSLTPFGQRLALAVRPSFPSCAELMASLRGSLGTEQRRAMDALVAAAPAVLDITDLAARTGLSPRSRKLRAGLATMTRAGLLRKSGAGHAASNGLVELMLR